jgi:hypothetical protein
MNQSTVKHALADIADQLDQDTRLALIKTLIDAHAAQTNRIEDTYDRLHATEDLRDVLASRYERAVTDSKCRKQLTELQAIKNTKENRT